MTLREMVGCATDASRDEIEYRAVALILELARERDRLRFALADRGVDFINQPSAPMCPTCCDMPYHVTPGSSAPCPECKEWR